MLLLGRASHCVATLEHCLLHNLPLETPGDPAVLRDLADVLALLAALCRHEPALVLDLMQQSVPFGSGAVARSWADVVAGVLAVAPQLQARLMAAGGGGGDGDAAMAAAEAAGASALGILADAMQLLAAVGVAAPGRVLALLPQLPLFGAQELFAGLPAAVPLDQLAAFQVGRVQQQVLSDVFFRRLTLLLP